MILKTTISLMFISFLLGCSQDNILDSDNYPRLEDRLQILKENILLKGEITDAEFELYNVNGFNDKIRGIIPGDSYWDYKYAVKANKGEIDNWTKGMIYVPSLSEQTWMKEIISNSKRNWATNSKPEYYSRKGDNVIMVLYRKEGFIFKRVINE